MASRSGGVSGYAATSAANRNRFFKRKAPALSGAFFACGIGACQQQQPVLAGSGITRRGFVLPFRHLSTNPLDGVATEYTGDSQCGAANRLFHPPRDRVQ